MSQLKLTTSEFGNFSLNVLAFSSPIFGSISGAQTKKMMQWYPIKANQPEIEFDVQFASEKDYEEFQNLVEKSQKWALSAPKPMIYLNWPERNINNWSGLITEFVGGGMRFNPAPRAKFVVFLFDNFIAQYTEMATVAPTFARALNVAMNIGFQRLRPNPYNLQLPSRVASQNQTPDQDNNPGYPTAVPETP